MTKNQSKDARCSKHGVVHRNGGYPSCRKSKDAEKDKSKETEDGIQKSGTVQKVDSGSPSEPISEVAVSSETPEARCECDDYDEMMSIDMDLDSLQEEYPNWIFSVKKAEHEENCPKSKEGAA